VSLNTKLRQLADDLQAAGLELPTVADVLRWRALERAVLAYDAAPAGSMAEGEARAAMHRCILAARAAGVRTDEGKGKG